MHMQGAPKTMQQHPSYRNVIIEVGDFLRDRARAAEAAGVPPDRIAIDPGFGFGKRLEHNLTLLARLRELCSIGYPLAVGTSRKSFIGAVLGDLPANDRLEGTAATVALAVAGGARIVRVHDVRAMVRVVRTTEAVLAAGR
jgi:dihydropteroate synthase